jgi:hypothetical protein
MPNLELQQLFKKGEVRKVKTIGMTGTPQLWTHPVAEQMGDANANPTDDGVTTADTVTVDYGQLVDTAILSDPLGVPLPNVAPDGNALGPQKMEQINGRRHAAVDVVLADGCDAEQQEPRIVHEESEPSVAKRFSMVSGPQEIFRTERNGSTFRKVSLHVEAGYESTVEDIIERNNILRRPMRGIPLPIREEPYGTTVELLTQIRKTILEQISVSNEVSAVLTYWVLSTWFMESLPIAPCLVITGASHEGDMVLRTLKVFCRFPLLMAGVSSASLRGIDWTLRPTLLLSEPNLSKQMTAVLGCSTSQGYLVGTAGKYQDYFGSKAIYLGEDPPIHAMPRFSLHVNAASMSKAGPGYARPLSNSIAQSFQDRLVDYRLKNLVRVHNSDFDASSLHSDTRSVANALGACIVDAPDLQAELVSLLVPRAQQQLEDRSNSHEALVIEGTLSLCHQGKLQIFVKEIADEVNRIQASRGETLRFTAEKVGHKLKKVGLCTRRLSSAGNGLLIDHTTRVRLHEVAAAFLDAGFVPDDQNLHCSLCNENKGFM